MRSFACVLGACSLLLLSAPAGAGELAGTDIVVSVLPGSVQGAEPEGADCSGFAPTEPGCVASFTVPDVDQFGVRIATDPRIGYTGTIEVQLKGSVGQTTIVCDLLLTADCVFQQVGPYFVGETVVLVAVASGFGSWIVQAPVGV